MKNTTNVLASEGGWGYHGGRKKGKKGKNGKNGRGRRGGGGGRHGGGRRRHHGGGGGFGRGLGYGLGVGLLGGGYGGYGYGYGYPPYGYGYPYRRGLFFGDKEKHEELKNHVESLKSALEDPSLSAEHRVRLETLGERIDELFPAGVLLPLTENLPKGDSDHEKVKEYNGHAKRHNLSIKTGYNGDMSKAERKRMQREAAQRALEMYELRKELKGNGNWSPC